MKSFFKNEDGSASVEFVVLALPLFIPLIIFLQQFASVSAEEGFARTLAREGARAYVSSSSTESAEEMMNKVIVSAGKQLGLTKEQFDRMAIGLECSNSPCHSPNGKVQVTIHFVATEQFRAVTASAQEYVSPWS
jgi:Flp pilus assembly protein TadG